MNLIGPSFISPLIIVVLLVSCTVCVSQDKIVLRDLSVITDSNVKSIDVNSLELDDGRRLFWDQVYSGQVADEHQKAFDQFVENPGAALFAIQTRLANGTFDLLHEPIEQLQPAADNLSNDNLILLEAAKFYLALNERQRINAIEPLLKIASMAERNSELVKRIPASAWLDFEPGFLLSNKLLPIFFDDDADKQGTAGKVKTYAEAGQDLPLCVGVYFLALGAPKSEKRKPGFFAKISSTTNSNFADWQRLFELLQTDDSTQSLVDFVKNNESQWPTSLIVTANFHLGKRLLLEDDQELVTEGQLRLLGVSSEFGETYPELAAAALHEVIQKRIAEGASTGVESLRNELKVRYPNTQFGSLIE